MDYYERQGGALASLKWEPVTTPGPGTGPGWDELLTTLGVFVKAAVVSPGTGYWKLARARFESDGEVLRREGEGNPVGRTTSIIALWIRTERRFKANGSSRPGPRLDRPTRCSISRRAEAWTITGEYFRCREDGVPSIPKGAGVPSAPTWETLRATRSGAWGCRAIVA